MKLQKHYFLVVYSTGIVPIENVPVDVKSGSNVEFKKYPDMPSPWFKLNSYQQTIVELELKPLSQGVSMADYIRKAEICIKRHYRKVIFIQKIERNEISNSLQKVI